MVFMHVMGDSMEPFIQDGDMVLVDQAQNQPARHGVYAVGFEDAIMLSGLNAPKRSAAAFRQPGIRTHEHCGRRTAFVPYSAGKSCVAVPRLPFLPDGTINGNNFGIFFILKVHIYKQRSCYAKAFLFSAT